MLNRLVLACCLLFWSGLLVAQNQVRGDASIRVEYQYIETGTFYDANFQFSYWNTKSHVALLSGEYSLSENWSVYASLPYVQKRIVPGELFNGDPHNPNDPWWIDFVPPDKRFIDDGDYHGGLQDLSFGMSYLAVLGPVTISPYIGYGYPTDDYPFYGKAAIGANLWSIPVGVDLMYVPWFSDWYFAGNLAYVFSEEPLDVNVDHWLGYLAIGHWFSPSFSVNVFVNGKYNTGGYVMPWSFTDDPNYGNYPDDFDTVYWWQHDRLLRNRWANAGIGFDWFIKGNLQLSGTWYTGIWAEQHNEVDSAFTLGLTRYFEGD